MPQTQKPRQPDPLVPETDPRFPSGKWTGFWLQRQYAGRQWMNLELAFVNGVVRGTGTDRIGEFALQGSYDLKTGRCQMKKAYVGAHTLEYDGQNEGDGRWLWGLWRLRSLDRGGFHMWPAGEDDPTEPKLRSAKGLPCGQRLKVAPGMLVDAGV